MSRSTDPGHFFQTTASIDETARKAAKSKNKKGDPIKLASKLLAIIPDPDDEGAVYVAEAAGVVRRVVLDSKSTTASFTGPTAPLTSLCLSPVPTSTTPRTLFAGCWDKTIWSWTTSPRRPSHRYAGHTDFVKCVLCVRVGGTDWLLSGSSDATIRVWSTATGECVQVVKGHARGVLALVVDPLSDENGVTVYSAGSDREIRRWSITSAGTEGEGEGEGEGGGGGGGGGGVVKVVGHPEDPLLVHETSINALVFAEGSGDLYTASSDNSAKILSRAQNLTPDTTFVHPDFVRGVAVDEERGYVVTACRDEEVRIWDAGGGKCVIVLRGHYEEVTGVVITGGSVVSCGIDGTVRKWGLGERAFEEVRREEEREAAGTEKEEGKKKSLLTEEEERELAELMEDSD